MRAAVVLAGLAAALALPGAATAATFAVNSTLDAADTSPGDGTCATAVVACTLRAAIMEANATPGQDTVVLPFGTYVLSVPGDGEDAAATGDLDVTDALILDGSGASFVDGNALDRVFEVTAAGVELQDVTVRNGARLGAGVAGEGGAIRNAGTLVLRRVVVAASLARHGGGIWNGGTLTALDGVVEGNVAESGGGIGNDPGGVLELHRTAVRGNSATGDPLSVGGGIANAGRLTAIDSTVSGNGAVSGAGLASTGVAALTSSTVSGNTASETAGGIRNDGSLTLTFVTLAANRALSTLPDRGGGLLQASFLATVTFRASLVAANLPSNCAVTTGARTSAGGNVESASTCGFAAPADRVDADVRLGPLAANGGPTQTHALGAGSAAVDAASPPCPAADQRGVSRPQGPACDAGAFELAGGGPGDGGGGSGGGGVTTIVGTPGDDVLLGTPGRDVIRGLGGNDRIAGLGGADVIDGGLGDDVLDGSAGDDVIRGGPGDDRANGGAGVDRLHGQAGNDILQGGRGSDSLLGGEGADVLEARGGGDDLVDGGPGRDRATADAGVDVVRRVEEVVRAARSRR